MHKLLHYLQSRLTLLDAFAVLRELDASSEPIERTLADLIAEILEDVRQELRVYTRLQGIYELVAGAPDDVDHEALRAESCRRFVELCHDRNSGHKWIAYAKGANRSLGPTGSRT